MTAAEAQYAYPELQAYYTDARAVNELMVDLLGNVSGLSILEPAAGEGAFVTNLRGAPSRLDAVEIAPEACAVLRQLPVPFIRVIRDDFIKIHVDDPLLHHGKLLSDYDAVIANPPYGLKIPIPVRKRIKDRYGDIYARESYGLFLQFSLGRLRKGGRFVFIIPDTFIFSVNHKPLRRLLVSEATVTHIIRFPSKLFEAVNFGYSGLCIVAGNKGSSDEGECTWAEVGEAGDLRLTQIEIVGRRVGLTTLASNVDKGWTQPHGQPENMVNTGCRALTLGDIADCKTGIYTGDNTRFIGFDKYSDIRRANGHPISWSDDVCRRALTDAESLNGISATPHYVPFIRGGHRDLFEETRWGLDWSVEAVRYYRTDKKARLQNQSFYFKPGLAVPMVTSGRLSASLMADAVFDQGVVGVFPNEDKLLPFLAIYLNSAYVSSLKPLINPSANNSANYLKRLPVPSYSDDLLLEAAALLEKLRASSAADRKREIDNFVFRLALPVKVGS